ncbi:MAG: ATP-binding protein [Methylococcales bacterium]|nr:ATP-binding protein [Methylococcales bacterium]
MNLYQDSKIGTENLITDFEKELYSLGSDINPRSVYSKARDILCELICEKCGISGNHNGNNIERVIGKIEISTKGHRDAAIILIRSLAVEGLLPIDEHGTIANKIISIIEKYLPEITKFLKIDKQQTFEKLNLIRSFHSLACSNFDILTKLNISLSSINNEKEQIYRALRHGTFQSYLQPFEYTKIKASIETVCSDIANLQAGNASSYKSNFDILESSLKDAITLVDSLFSFFSINYVNPFFNAITTSLLSIKENSGDQFKSSINTLRFPPKSAVKKYPLHQVDKHLIFSVPLINKGPGTAIDVIVEIDCGEDNQTLILDSDLLRLGDVPPGEFSLPISACILEASESTKMTVQINWREVFGEEKATIFDLKIEGQDPTIDWASLEQFEPYSLEVAEGDMFVGRVEKVKAIGNKLLKKPMVSTYLTGQKRVGKTSLAQAVLNYIKQQNPEFKTIYLEYGEYCQATAQKTIRSLGESIFEFLQESMPKGHQFSPDFSESISDLNKYARILESERPNLRFVIVLDEFDEIRPEMYSFGPIAETFFANLRTLATRSNLAFILVGGERMPFIIGSQGDQLNKFSSTTLDYFSRSSEWVDYVELVRKPVNSKLNWDDAAINALFHLTNGHPYYTKLLCSKVFTLATSIRDTEIVESDVETGLLALLPEIDTNAFAHFWKDGIDANGNDEIEAVMELKRLRVLVGIGKSFRNKEYTIDSIIKNVNSIKVQEREIVPILEDFIRRNIIIEENNKIHFTSQFFEKWLVEYGTLKLITTTLADKLEEGIKDAEDRAFVTSSEIQKLISRWPLYRSRSVDGEGVRAWLEQVPTYQEQRYLFKILDKLRFLSGVEISEKFKIAHEKFVKPIIGAVRIIKKTDKRNDIWLTYVDGVGKSGAQCARDYAKENSISTQCILEPTTIQKRLSSSDDKPKAIIVIDDVSGTGKTLFSGVNKFSEDNRLPLLLFNIPILVIVLVSTVESETKLRSLIDVSSLNIIHVKP